MMTEGPERRRWSRASESCWAKIDPLSDGWRSLPLHLEHTALIAPLVWDHLLPLSIRQQLARGMGLDERDARTLYAFFAGAHDVGKASPTFATQAPPQMAHLLGPMRDHGLVIDRPEHIRHEVISQLALTDWLVAKGAPRQVANTWASPLAGHHGRHPSGSTLNKATREPHTRGIGAWQQVRAELLDGMNALTGADAAWDRVLGRGLPAPTQLLLTGAVVLADWMASDESAFPYDDDLTPEARAPLAFTELGVPPRWTPRPPLTDASGLLATRFPHLRGRDTRPLQDAAITVARTCSDAPLLLIEAPMGTGKTEAALLAAEVLAERFGQGGVFVGLPTMATSNPMFTRVAAWLGQTLTTEDASLALAHGKAALNDEYSDMLRHAWHGQIHDEERIGDSSSGARPGRAVAASWLRGRRKTGLASFVVGTIDQALFCALKARHVAVRQFGMAGKVVIIDEVHAADTYMREYLLRTLSWLGAHRTPVILMSATLPPRQRAEFIAEYAAGRGEPAPPLPDEGDAYPRITCYDGELQTLTPSHDSRSTLVTVHRLPDDLAVLVETLADALAEGGCAGVICNTVGRAQQTFDALRAAFPDEVELAHSRFLAPDRSRREASLVDRLGPGGERPHRLIVVGTQVLEQSLDIDFDFMVTDIAPMDLVLQRCGRLHRHEIPRPPALRTARLYVRGLDWQGEPPDADAGSRAIYRAGPLLRSAALIMDRHEIHLPTDIPTLVRQAYDPDAAPPPGWEDVWKQADAEVDGRSDNARRRAQTYLLVSPTKPMHLTGLLDVEVGDPEHAEAQGQSVVRDSEDSLEVIALFRDDEGALRLPASAPRHPGALLPLNQAWGSQEESLARAMAACTLPLPIQLANGSTIDTVIAQLEGAQGIDYSLWQQSRWLRGQLILVFDPHSRAELAGFELHYGDRGLSVARIQENA